MGSSAKESKPLEIVLYPSGIHYYAENIMRQLLLAAALLALTPLLHAEDSGQEPTLSGHITRINAPRDMEVSGIHILTTTSTRMSVGDSQSRITSDTLTPVLGQTAHVFGKLDRKHHTLTAAEIWLVTTPSGDNATVSGTAIVDLIPAPTPATKPGTVLLRADGYRILLTPGTALTSTLPDPTLAGIRANTWITYHGIRKPDGTILADKASFAPNIIVKGENKLLDKTDYAPDQVDADAKQGNLSKFVKGIDPKQIPPYQDAAMQARIDRIGASLIPAYQRTLQEDDLTKITFRFQLIDKKWPDALTLPSGVILVPHQVVDHLQNDSQLATVLADNIACALEKQTYRMVPATQAMGAANLAGLAGGFFVPGLGLATSLATGGTAATIVRHNREQSGRVSLTLLHDAGYDIREAPRTWWLLNAKPGKDIADITIPARANYLYETLANVWSDQSEPTPHPD